MKRHFLTIVGLILSVALFAQVQFYVRVNSSVDYPANPVGEADFQGRTQYVAENVGLKTGDIITFYDAVTNAVFSDAALEEYDEGVNFENTGSGFKCKADGCYNIYLKLKFEDNTIYIGSGTNCSGGTTGGGTGGATEALTVHDFYLIGWINGGDHGESAYDVFEDDYKFSNGKFAINCKMGSYVAVKDDKGNFYYAKDVATDNAEGSAVSLIWASGWTPCKKWHLDEGQHYLIIEQTSGFKQAVNLRDVSKAEFDAYVWDTEDALENVEEHNFTIQNREIITSGDLRIYSILGQDVTYLNGNLQGVYIVHIDGNRTKVMIP